MHPAGYREITKWLARNRNSMIDCPRQPGNLWISKNACGKRYQASLNPDLKIYAEDFFGFSFRQGLAVCRDCRIGKNLSSS
jgi:hypothetical protein